MSHIKHMPPLQCGSGTVVVTCYLLCQFPYGYRFSAKPHTLHHNFTKKVLPHIRQHTTTYKGKAYAVSKHWPQLPPKAIAWSFEY